MDLGVDDAFDVGGSVVCGPETEELEAGTGLGVVYHVEG